MNIDTVDGLVAGSIFMMLIAVFCIILIVRFRQRQFQNREMILHMQASFQQELLHAQLEIQEQTLKNIAQEIHDNIGQTLSLVKLNLHTMDPGKPSALMQKIDNSKVSISKAIHDLRNLSRSLNNDSILSAGLLKAIETELSLIEKAGVYKTSLQINGQPVRLDEKKELILFRMIQEAVNNIIKHANASHILVLIDHAGDSLSITIKDDGSGFVDTKEDSLGSGLRNMRSRAQLIGGQLQLHTGPQGTTIQITIPIIVK